jgi:hypothetical protein
MSVVPRIVFARFVSTASPKLQPWTEHVQRVVGTAAIFLSDADPSREECAVVWHLVAGNNRQLARSARILGSFEGARADARRTIEVGLELAVSEVSEHARGVYGWYASYRGEPVMTCSRWYETERDRRHAIELALRSLDTTSVHTGARLVDDVRANNKLRLAKDDLTSGRRSELK